MEIREYLSMITKHKDLIIKCLLITIFIVAIMSLIQRPVYESHVKILVESKSSNSALLNQLAAGDAMTALSRTGNPIETQIEIIKTTPILSQVIDALGLTNRKGNRMSEKTLRASINIQSIRLTDIIAVSVQNRDPKLSADIANMIGIVFVAETQKSTQTEANMAKNFIETQLKSLSGELSNVEAGPGKGVNIVQDNRKAIVAQKTYVMLLEKLEEARIAAAIRSGYARIIEPAEVPSTSVRPRRLMNIFLGAIFGLMLGIGMAVSLESLDDSFKSADEVKERLKLPVLSSIPNYSNNTDVRSIKGPDKFLQHPAVKVLLEKISNIMKKGMAS